MQIGFSESLISKIGSDFWNSKFMIFQLKWTKWVNSGQNQKSDEFSKPLFNISFCINLKHVLISNISRENFQFWGLNRRSMENLIEYSKQAIKKTRISIICLIICSHSKIESWWNVPALILKDRTFFRSIGNKPLPYSYPS